MKFKSKKAALSLATAVIALAAFPGAVSAQDQSDADAESRDEVIVVTGTLIRGVEATGSQTIDLDQFYHFLIPHLPHP